jgi:DivIVA protein
MKAFEKPGATFEEPVKRRPQSSLLGDLGDRLARTFSVSEREETLRKPNGNGEAPLPDERPRTTPVTAPRFSIVRQGYDSAAVDDYLGELEQELIDLDRELAELQARTPSGTKVAAEIERIGEQTSTILLAAHDQAQQTTSRAQAEADRCIADAASNAIAITEDANRQLRQLEADKNSLRAERARLLDDIRGLATTLSSLAADAADRFPSEREITVMNAAGEPPDGN